MVEPLKVLKINTRLIFSLNSDSPYHPSAESPTPRLPDSTIRRVGGSQNQWCGESPTPRISDAGSWRQICRVGDSPYQWLWGVVYRIWISPRNRSQNQNDSKGSVRDSWGTNFCKNPRKSASLPCPFKISVVHDWYRFFEYSCSWSTLLVECKGS
jgi:hypothetical protein